MEQGCGGSFGVYPTTSVIQGNLQIEKRGVCPWEALFVASQKWSFPTALRWNEHVLLVHKCCYRYPFAFQMVSHFGAVGFLKESISRLDNYVSHFPRDFIKWKTRFDLPPILHGTFYLFPFTGTPERQVPC